MTRMNRATSIAPNSSPVFQTLTLPSSPSMPYRPLIGAISESTTIRCGFAGTVWYEPGIGSPSLFVSYGPAGMIQVSERDQDDEDEQDRVGRRQREARLAASPGDAAAAVMRSLLQASGSPRGRRGGVAGGRLRRPGRRDVLDPEAGEPVDERDQRAREVEEAVRQVGDRRDAEDARHVRAAAVPRHERRGHRARVLDGPRQHPRRDAALGELQAVDAARHHDRHVLVAGDDVQAEAGQR